MLDAALTDTISQFPVDIQPFRDMVEGMRMDLVKPRYDTYDELYEYCYRVAGSVGLMTMPIMGIDPSYKVCGCGGEVLGVGVYNVCVCGGYWCLPQLCGLLGTPSLLFLTMHYCCSCPNAACGGGYVHRPIGSLTSAHFFWWRS